MSAGYLNHIDVIRVNVLGTVAAVSDGALQKILSEALKVRGTQTRLAGALDVPVTTVNNWARGKNVPEAHRWSAIEDALGLESGTIAAALGVTQPDLSLSDAVREIQASLGVLREQLAQLSERVDRLDGGGRPARRSSGGRRPSSP